MKCRWRGGTETEVSVEVGWPGGLSSTEAAAETKRRKAVEIWKKVR